MFGVCLSPDVPGLVAAVAVEATRRLAALLTEKGGVQFPAALRAVGESDSGHGPSLLRHIEKRQLGAGINHGPARPILLLPFLTSATAVPHPPPELPVSGGPARRARGSPSLPPDNRQPRLRPALAEGQVFQVGADLVAFWLDGFDGPALGEGVVQFFLRHPPWPLRARLLVAEAEQEQPTARLQDTRQALDVPPAVVVVEDVEQAAVDHAVEHFGEVFEGQGVHHEEGGRQPPLGRLAPGPGDRLFEEVDARDLVAPTGEEEGVVAGAAPGVEDGAGDPVGHVEERPLRPADVPRRLPGVGRFKGVPVGHAAHRRDSSLRSSYALRCLPLGWTSRYVLYPPPTFTASNPACRRMRVAR